MLADVDSGDLERGIAAVQPRLGPKSKVDYKAVPILQAMKEIAPTPDFNLATPDGKKLSLKDFRGKIVLLNFWASWCVPCREEMPAMEKLYQEFKGQKLCHPRDGRQRPQTRCRRLR